ncbi:unnamed protein product [Orchesella dallaii]|uniref:Uncharacterized protein n=1 Tax=Orchesella dallaii TaxID=48710 RepID=A0ABP1S867_9HEXA
MSCFEWDDGWSLLTPLYNCWSFVRRVFRRCGNFLNITHCQDENNDDNSNDARDGIREGQETLEHVEIPGAVIPILQENECNTSDPIDHHPIVVPERNMVIIIITKYYETTV